MNKNKWKSNTGWKIGMVVVSFVTAAVVFISGAAVILIGAMGAYNYSKEEALEDHYDSYSWIDAVLAMANRE